MDYMKHNNIIKKLLQLFYDNLNDRLVTVGGFTDYLFCSIFSPDKYSVYNTEFESEGIESITFFNSGKVEIKLKETA
jgi:hypothetical protein